MPLAAETAALLCREVIHGHRALEQRVIARDYGDAAIGDEVAFLIGFGIEPDDGPLRLARSGT